MPPQPMRANPGGQLALQSIIGRDEFIDFLWSALDQQSLVLNAERRIGKTSIIKKMVGQPQGGKICIYQDLERIHTISEFASLVFDETQQHLTRAKRAKHHLSQLISNLRGTEVGGVLKLPENCKLPWKDILTSTLKDICANDGQPAMILFWDELPLMLYNIKQREGETVAMELLDTLRALRQTLPSLRMVFTGSIGIHNVIASLKKAGFANAPLNDMRNIIVPPLKPDDGIDLALGLFDGERLTATNLRECAQALSSAVDHVPYYIHHVVANLCASGTRVIDPTIIAQAIQNAMIDPLDTWHMKHYAERLELYYEAMERKLAFIMLDEVAASGTPLRFGELFSRLQAQLPFEDRDVARHVLALLERDHYLIRDQENTYHFTFPLIRRWWKMQRDLA